MGFRLLPDRLNVDFFKPVYLYLWLAVSAGGVLLSIALYLMVGLNYGVDFRGGTLIMASTPDERPVAEFRDVLTGLDIGEVNVTEISDDTGQDRNLVLMRLDVSGEGATDTIAGVREALTTSFPGIQFLQVDSVGAKVSGELVTTGFLAVGLSFLAIMVYVWLRFEWQFAVASVVSLIHDAIVTIGVLSVLQIEFNLTIVAAILSIIGFSINDTVVVFDRVRENLRKYKQMPLKDVMNLSMNETLSRTMITVFTTLLALVAIYWFGGDVVSGFAFAVIWGVICGTYSSIYVATAIVLWLGVKRDWSKPEKAGARAEAQV